MQMLSTLIFMKLEKCIVHFCKYNLLVYAALLISYVLFFAELAFTNCENWALQIGFTLCYSIMICLIETRLQKLVYLVKEECRWILMASMGAAKLIVIATLVSLDPNIDKDEVIHNVVLGISSAALCILGIIFAYILF